MREETLLAQDLFDAARAAMALSHSPYSQFPVGAAVRDENGRIHAGCNIENASYPLGQCAEATAIGQMIMAGGRRIAEIAVIAGRAALCAPCGGCRQKLAEFAAPGMRIWLCNETGPQKALTLGELLPEAFGPDVLP